MDIITAFYLNLSFGLCLASLHGALQVITIRKRNKHLELAMQLGTSSEALVSTEPEGINWPKFLGKTIRIFFITKLSGFAVYLAFLYGIIVL